MIFWTKMKKFFPTLNDLAEANKKRLDKVDELLYNIRTGLKRKSMEYKTLSTNDNPRLDPRNGGQRGGSEIALSAAVCSHINNYTMAEFKYDPQVVVAGGAVRDAYFGYRPRDIDIFLSTPPDESPEDYLVLLTEALRATTPDLFPEYAHKSPSIEYGGPNDNFVVYNLEAQLRDRIRGTRFQFITRSQDELTDPRTLCTGFDHDLVRCYFDGKWHFSDAFLECVRVGRVQPDSEKSRQRLLFWRDRTGHKIVIGKVPSKKVETSNKIYIKTPATQSAFLNQLVVAPPNTDVFLPA